MRLTTNEKELSAILCILLASLNIPAKQCTVMVSDNDTKEITLYIDMDEEGDDDGE